MQISQSTTPTVPDARSETNRVRPSPGAPCCGPRAWAVPAWPPRRRSPRAAGRPPAGHRRRGVEHDVRAGDYGVGDVHGVGDVVGSASSSAAAPSGTPVKTADIPVGGGIIQGIDAVKGRRHPAHRR